MRIRKAFLVPAVLAGVLIAPGVASAHPVGTPGEPNCFGERVSHAASDHGLRPKDRAAGMQELLGNPPPDIPAPLLAQLRAFFGPTVEVREIQAFVRLNCSDNPLIPEPPQG
jgi:hypothetical protein